MNKQELIKHFEEMEYVSISLMGKKAFIDLIEQLDEPQKPVVPQFVADYIEFKKEYDFHVYGAMRVIEDHYDKRVQEWFYEGNIETFVRAWLDGYRIEEEKRYLVKVKGVDSRTNYLYYGEGSKTWLFKAKLIDGNFRKSHTRKELEQDNFGWVFDCPGIEIEVLE